MHSFRGSVLAVAVAAGACATSAQPSRQQTGSDVVATVGTTTITLADVDERAMALQAGTFGGLTLRQAIYESRRMVLDDMIGNRLIDDEAKARGVDRNALVEQEITAKVAAPTDAEVAAWFAANQNRVQGASLDQVRAPIRSLLLEERTAEARSRYLDRLKAATAVTITLEPPRQRVADAGRPARGPASAPIQIIEFSDFECPFCFRANPTVTQVLAAYGDRVRLVYRHFPLPNHPNARPAAEAAACANEQGKFWEYHDRLFANQSRLASADLKQHAAELGLDAATFNACVDTRKYQKDVEDDVAAGQAVGVTGTPAFFINGRLLSGAQPLENFKRVIDEELDSR